MSCWHLRRLRVTHQSISGGVTLLLLLLLSLALLVSRAVSLASDLTCGVCV
jgi:hypothetical protein